MSFGSERPMHRFNIVHVAAMLLLATSSAEATMGAKTMFERLDSDHDGTISRSEVTVAAGKKYDLIASKNHGHVTSIALSGRLSKGALQDIENSNSSHPSAEPDSVSREQYLSQADKAFDEARIDKEGDSLDLGELGAPSARNLIDLLQ